jgi:parallel beta-helix repeat protein
LTASERRSYGLLMRWTFALLAVAIGALGLASAAAAKTIKVNPGQSIQAAVDQANPGDRVLVKPGTYQEDGHPCPTNPSQTCAVSIEKDGIRLVGVPSKRHRVVLQAKADQDDGIAVGKLSAADCLTDASKRLHGSVIRGLTVRGFEDDGVFLICVDHWRVTRVRAVDNDEYGIFPSHTAIGRLDHSFASGANDTGHYIGQSTRARVDHNVARGNVSGFELENSSHIRADHNLATGNTGGILSFALPNLDIKSNADNRIDHNRVRGNNKANTCVEPGDAVCTVPVGTGILLIATDRNRVVANRVSGNNSFGIALANYCLATRVQEPACSALDIEPNPDGNRILNNRVRGNGSAPDPNLPPVFAVDLAWDGTGTDNCWAGNRFGTSFPVPLPACP